LVLAARRGLLRARTLSASVLAWSTGRIRRLRLRVAGALNRWYRVAGVRRLVLSIALAVALPTVVWFLTASLLAWERYQTVLEMRETVSLAEFAVAGHDAIHALQTERSLAATRLAGGNSFFEARLIEAHGQADSAIAALGSRMAQLSESPAREALAACLQDLDRLREEVRSLRISVDISRFDVIEAVDGYNHLIEGLTVCLTLIEEATAQAVVTRHLRALRAFTTYKDFADLERGYGTALLAGESWDARVQQGFLRYSEVQLPYLRRMLTEPSPELARALSLVNDGDAQARLIELRRHVGNPGNAPPMPEVWFAVASERFERMRAAERELMEAVTDTASGIQIVAQRELTHMLLGFGVAALFLPILSAGIAAGVGRRMQDERQQTMRIEYLATRDSLTGLFNRRHFEELAETAIREAHKHRRPLALFVVDLQRFGDINHIWSEAVGNRILREVARRIRDAAGDACVVGRTYGDEFSILCPDVGDNGKAQVLADALMANFESPFDIGDRHIHVNAKCGAAIYPRDAENYTGLLVAAQMARDVAKDSGGEPFQFFVPGMYERFRYQTTMEQGLEHAVERGELDIEFQPRILLADESMVAAEALLRWNHPRLGRVTPERFIRVAEATGAILGIGRWVLTEGCRQAKAWTENGMGRMRLSVNLSAVQFHQANIVDDVCSALETSGLEPALLELEVTETAVMVDMDHSIDILHRLRELGVTLSIDDFGTGYSSLSYLQKFPVQQLKLDKAFVRNLPTDYDAVAIAESVISLANALSLEVVAEGVETLEQSLFLRRTGCLEAQGYLYSRPLSEIDLHQFAIQRNSGLASA
jgi:diguanylate cyclase (GGDEF)-like protein